MIKYSRMNKGYKYILQILIFFQNMHGLFLLNLKKLSKILNHVLKKYLKNENLNTFGLIKNQLHSSVKKC